MMGCERIIKKAWVGWVEEGYTVMERRGCGEMPTTVNKSTLLTVVGSKHYPVLPPG